MGRDRDVPHPRRLRPDYLGDAFHHVGPGGCCGQGFECLEPVNGVVKPGILRQVFRSHRQQGVYGQVDRFTAHRARVSGQHRFRLGDQKPGEIGREAFPGLIF